MYSYVGGGAGGKSACTSVMAADIKLLARRLRQAILAKPALACPADGKRDIPDVSLFAATDSTPAAFTLSARPTRHGIYCDQNPEDLEFSGCGGTSASSPSFAGIMALVNQKTASRQGNANYILYKLAAQSGASCTSPVRSTGTTCIFYDITTGPPTPCRATTPGQPDCQLRISGPSGIGILTGYNAAAGYDLATGLGSVNAANLVNKWSTITSAPSQGHHFVPHSRPDFLDCPWPPMTVQIGVTPTPPAPALPPATLRCLPTAPAPEPAPTAISRSANGSVPAGNTTTALPGGTYAVTAHYPGDGTFAASDSSPFSVTVNPEPSKTQAAIVTFSNTGALTSSNAITFTYGSFYILRSNVTNASGNLCAPNGTPQYGCPTGTVTLKDTFNGATNSLDRGHYALNSEGYAEDQAIFLLGGQHSIVASYGGDPSYTASNNSSTPDVITVTKARQASVW